MKSKNLGPYLIVLLVAISLGLYFLSKTTVTEIQFYPLTAIGQMFALIGATLLSVNFMLSSRIPLLEKLFGGVDKVYYYHHVTGGIAFCFLLLHPVFLILPLVTSDPASAASFIIPLLDWRKTFGELALWTLIIILFITFYVNLPYHIWKKVHEFIGLSLVFGVIHAYFIPSDVAVYLPLRLWILGLMVIAGVAYFYIRFLYPRIGPMHHYRVIKSNLRGNTTDLMMASVTKPLQFKPGQFVFVSFPKFGTERHPFSFANTSDSHGNVRIAVKKDGDYTNKLDQIKEGDTAILWGPYGRFGELMASSKDVIFVAGGIGITPFLGMLAAENKQPLIRKDGSKRKVTVFYSVRETAQSPYWEEIQQIAASGDVKAVLHTSADKGRITADFIKEQAGGLEKKMVFICGPQKMMEDLRKQLMALGVKQSRIILEDFSLI